MAVHLLAGARVPRSMRVRVADLVTAFYGKKFGELKRVEFGTSGHRGKAVEGSFNLQHIQAISQAIAEYRAQKDITGPLYLGFDTHALSIPAFRTALEVFAANGVEVIIANGNEYTPTPVISFSILAFNKSGQGRQADGVVITPSHNPPDDGGFKYNPPNGGPADTQVTGWIEKRANAILEGQNQEVRIMPYERARKAATTIRANLMMPYVRELHNVVDMDAIRGSGLRLGADPMGGSGVHYWGPINEFYGLDIEVVHPEVDKTFATLMRVDSDGKIRMDCSSTHAMAGLIEMKDDYDVAFGNDPDFDRHGIVDANGLMNPNHYLAVAIEYLLGHRPDWSSGNIGKTLVSSLMIDRVVEERGGSLMEVPVGFKWFVDGLSTGDLVFGGEESAGACFLRRVGRTWVTEKDGFIMDLLAAEIAAKTGKLPSALYAEQVERHGNPFYRRDDGPVTAEQKAILATFDANSIVGASIAGTTVVNAMTKAPGNGANIGGVKAVLAGGSWFAIRPSGTEPKMKVYVEVAGGGASRWQQVRDEATPLILGA